jgi:hypothetical protein
MRRRSGSGRISLIGKSCRYWENPGVEVTHERQTAEGLDGERKTVTALFADIKGSMDLMEDIDPEEARAIIDPALKLMMDAVHRYEGYVAQSTGLEAPKRPCKVGGDSVSSPIERGRPDRLPNDPNSVAEPCVSHG